MSREAQHSQHTANAGSEFVRESALYEPLSALNEPYEIGGMAKEIIFVAYIWHAPWPKQRLLHGSASVLEVPLLHLMHQMWLSELVLLEWPGTLAAELV